MRDLFERAAAVPPEARAQFLADSCGSDERIRTEVERLLVSHERAGSFLEGSPAIGDVGPHLEGRQIGPYQIGPRVGAGGMGEVYSAEDTRLGRRVAIKVLWHRETRAKRLKANKRLYQH